MKKNLNNLTKTELLKEIEKYPNIIKFLDDRPMDILIKAFKSLKSDALTLEYFEILDNDEINKDFIIKSKNINIDKLFILGHFLIKNNRTELISHLLKVIATKDIYNNKQDDEYESTLPFKQRFYRSLKSLYPTVSDFFEQNKNIILNDWLLEYFHIYKQNELLKYFEQNHQVLNMFLTSNVTYYFSYLENIIQPIKDIENYIYQNKQTLFKVFEKQTKPTLLTHSPSLFIRCVDEAGYRDMLIKQYKCSMEPNLSHYINIKFQKESDLLISSFYEKGIFDRFSLQYLIDRSIFHHYDPVLFFERIIKVCQTVNREESNLIGDFFADVQFKFDIDILNKIESNHSYWFYIINQFKDKFNGLPELINTMNLLNIEIKTFKDILSNLHYLKKDNSVINDNLLIE